MKRLLLVMQCRTLFYTATESFLQTLRGRLAFCGSHIPNCSLQTTQLAVAKLSIVRSLAIVLAASSIHCGWLAAPTVKTSNLGTLEFQSRLWHRTSPLVLDPTMPSAGFVWEDLVAVRNKQCCHFYAQFGRLLGVWVHL